MTEPVFRFPDGNLEGVEVPLAPVEPPPPYAPAPEPRVRFFIKRIQLIEGCIDREEFLSLFEDGYDDNHASDADKSKLKELSEKAWQQLLQRKGTFYITAPTQLTTVNVIDGNDWMSWWSGRRLMEGVLNTYKELGRLWRQTFES